MPKLIKRTGKTTTIPGHDRVEGVPGHYRSTVIEKVIPGYFQDNGGYYAIEPGHWEYPTKIIIDPFVDPVMGTGAIFAYEANLSPYRRVIDESAPKVWVPAEMTWYNYQKTWVPEEIVYKPGESVWVPATETIPAVPDVTVTENVSGWNAWSRSIDPIGEGTFFGFRVTPGVRGAFCSLGIKSLVGRAISDFAHAILVDNTGVHIYENGTEVQTIKGDYSEVTDLRIIRQSLTSIIYMAITGGESLIYHSTVAAAVTTLYGFGYLYDGGDSLSSSEITSGTVQYGRA